MLINDITITSLETITAFNPTSGEYLFTLDELQSATISQGQEVTDITGKQGRKLSSLKRNKTATIEASNGIVSAGLLALQTGGDFKKGPTEVMWTDYLPVKDNKATTNWKAIGTAGSEIEGIYLRNADGTLGEEIKQAAKADEKNTFAYDPETKVITFNNVEDGSDVIVMYKRKINASVLENHSDVYSGKATLYVDAIGEDKCANIYRIQFYFPKADVNGEFSFEMGDNQTVHSFSAEALSGACGAGAVFWTFTVFGADTKDEGEEDPQP